MAEAVTAIATMTSVAETSLLEQIVVQSKMARS